MNRVTAYGTSPYYHVGCNMAKDKNMIICAGQDTARRAPKINTITCGDCLSVMPLIPDKSVDMILCDLPYGTTACAWDVVIQFCELWRQYERIRKPNAPVVLFGSGQFYCQLVCSNISNFKEEIIWLKNRGASGFGAGKRHIKIHESIAVFYGGKFSPQISRVEDVDFLTKRKTFDKLEIAQNNVYSAKKKVRKPDNGTRQPVSVVPYRVTINMAKNKRYNHDTDINLHPTQKPIGLVEYLVLSYSNKNDTVLDNCIGSGTTAVACINTGRNYIGIEKEEKYCKIAEERTSCAKKSAQDTKEVFHTSPNSANLPLFQQQI